MRTFFEVKVKLKTEDEKGVKWIPEVYLVEAETLTEIDVEIHKVPDLQGEEFRVTGTSEKKYNGLLVLEAKKLEHLSDMQHTELEIKVLNGKLEDLAPVEQI